MRPCSGCATACPPTWSARRLVEGQTRSGHRGSATTLRHYSHATPLDGTDVADQLGVGSPLLWRGRRRVPPGVGTGRGMSLGCNRKRGCLR